MTRSIAAFAVAAVALAACGTETSDTDPEAAEAGVERAAHVTLAAEAVAAEPREHSLKASYSNAGTVATDWQVVALFVVKNADLAGQVYEQVRRTATKSAKLIVDGNVLVVYAPAGNDGLFVVEQAVKAL